MRARAESQLGPAAEVGQRLVAGRERAVEGKFLGSVGDAGGIAEGGGEDAPFRLAAVPRFRADPADVRSHDGDHGLGLELSDDGVKGRPVVDLALAVRPLAVRPVEPDLVDLGRIRSAARGAGRGRTRCSGANRRRKARGGPRAKDRRRIRGRLRGRPRRLSPTTSPLPPRQGLLFTLCDVRRLGQRQKPS